MGCHVFHMGYGCMGNAWQTWDIIDILGPCSSKPQSTQICCALWYAACNIIYLRYDTVLEFSIIDAIYFGLICEWWSNFAQWHHDKKPELGLIWNILPVLISYRVGECQYFESRIGFQCVLAAQKDQYWMLWWSIIYLGRYLGFVLALQCFGFV